MGIDVYQLARELSAEIEGAVFDQGDRAFDATVQIDNSRIERQPLLVVRPQTAEDIQTILAICLKHKVRLTTKSGGHSATGYCLNGNGIVLDLLRMNQVRYSEDRKCLQVGAGTRWIEIYDFLRNMGDKRIVCGGGCPTVGVAGFLLGGGFSFLSRSLGLGSDNVESIEFTTIDGKIHTVGTHSRLPDDKELFWALQGGGGGNFGIATKFVLKLREVANPLMTGQITFPFYRIDQVLQRYDQWSQTLPKEMAVYGMMRNFPDPRNNGRSMLALRFTPIYNGPYVEGIDLLKPLLDLAPISSEFFTMTLPEWEHFIGSGTQVKGHAAYIRSLMMNQGDLTQSIQVFKHYMARRPSPDSYIVWTQTGGAIRERSSLSAYPHRDSDYVVEVKSIWPKARPDLMRQNVEWAYEFFEQLQPHSHGAYLNYIDPLLDNWQNKYYGDSYARLLAVKKKHDRRGFFNFQQGIGSSFNPNPPDPDQSKRWLDLSPLDRTFND